MARRRQTHTAGYDRFTDSRVETWLTEADLAAVKGSGTDPAALAAVTGGMHDLMRFCTIPAGRRAEWALASLAAGHRCRAIAAWARTNNINPARAIGHFVGDAEVVSR